ncbi:hypothetical protein [Desulfocurvus sp.]|uniref:hypothetical protein n=1 Tax=Desulfocurvus sp. TaxID=2871698 RepID=UPI0025B83DAC|nr:hypothetical protein [Desulfocurvus sp.]MCK9241580.1 hypothetical protein [Desulfocurvus sp.]
MARVFLKMALAATLLLAAGLALSGCQTTGSGTGAAKAPAAAPAAPAAPGAQADPVVDLEERMFLLSAASDRRTSLDMRFIVVRAVNRGVNEEEAYKAAQKLSFADFRGWLNESAQAHRVAYLGGGKLRVDALNLSMDGVAFGEANFVFRLVDFVTAGRTIKGASLDQLVLDGRDLTDNAGLKVYELLLNRALGL